MIDFDAIWRFRDFSAIEKIFLKRKKAAFGPYTFEHEIGMTGKSHASEHNYCPMV